MASVVKAFRFNKPPAGGVGVGESETPTPDTYGVSSGKANSALHSNSHASIFQSPKTTKPTVPLLSLTKTVKDRSLDKRAKP